ncbi:hypothetical protein ACVWW9_000705 [Agrococcus sp. UYP33]
MLVGMDATREPTPQGDEGEQHETTREELSVTVRRSPRYGVFMAIGSVLGIVTAWILSSIAEPAVNEAGQPVDTTAVIGLVLVIGFVAGAAIGGIVALIVDRSLAKGTRTAVAERVETRERETLDELAAADAGEGAFEHLDSASGVDAAPTALDVDGAGRTDARDRGADDDRPREA